MTAPSFSSFPPSFSSFPDLDAGPSNAPLKNAPPTSSSGKDKKKRKHDEKRKGERRKERHYKRNGNKKEAPVSDVDERLPSADESSTSKQQSGDTSDAHNTFFYSDRKGDPLNLQYGGLHAGHIAKHRLVAGGRNVLGLPKSVVVLRRLGKGIEIGPNNYRKSSSLTDSSSRTALLKPPTRRITAHTDSNKYQDEDGFIRLPSRRRQVIPEVESYRSITVAKDDNNSDSSLQSDSDENSSLEDEDDAPTLSAHQETLRNLDQELARNPGGIDTWLTLLQQMLSTIPITSKNATKARCEITVSILTRALAAIPQNAGSKELRIPYLKAGEEIWHESKLRSEWEESLKAGGIELLMEWLEWRIRKGNNGVDGVVDSAVRALGSLGDDEEAEMGKLRIFWRVAIALRGAGYCERAMAMFQAQAEMLFNLPPALSPLIFQNQLNELEEFWESDAPRIGEENSVGWATWYSSSKVAVEYVPAEKELQSTTASDLDPYRQWARQELDMDRNAIMPLRSNADSVDPYSTVLFSDIQSMILNIKSRRAKSAFRLVWLSFLGLHTPGFTLATDHTLDWDDRWNLGHMTKPSLLNSIFPSDCGQRNLLTDTVAGVVIGRERDYKTPFGPVRCWGNDVSGPLDLSSSDPSKPLRRGIWAPEDVQDIDEAIVKRLFADLRLDHDDYEWHSLALAFEVATNLKSATKTSKSALAVHQDSLPLWNAHAQLERMRGRFSDARKVYQTVLIANAQKRTQSQISLMWWNWAEMEWLAGDDHTALNVILKSVGLEGSHSGVTILRGKRSLEENASLAGARSAWKEQEGWIKLRALLELLTTNKPTLMLTVFDEHLSSSRSASAEESLMTSSLTLLYCHGTTLKRPMTPSLLRERAHMAFTKYPNNSIILGILLEAERGQGIWGRVRSLLGGNDGKAKDVARRIEEVWVAGWERTRWTTELERTRNGLAGAIEHERTRASFIIWRIYIEFEIRANNLQQAKKLFFRAIGECPLVKDIYLLAFGPLRSVFQVHELNGLADTMAERGIRLRQNLDEILEGTEVKEEGGREGSEDRDDEIEHDARELRRLMPY